MGVRATVYILAREVRRLEKEEVWSCDSPDCCLSWDQEAGPFLDRPRYRCVHYRSGGRCNIDICGSCFPSKHNEQVRIYRLLSNETYELLFSS